MPSSFQNVQLFPTPHPLNARFWRGKSVGLLGGTFNPAHEGHDLIARRALRELSLDCVWWMVAAQNPLKKKRSEQTDFDLRMESVHRFTDAHPRMVTCDLEAQIQASCSYDTVVFLRQTFAQTRFTWLAGLDNLHTMHRWVAWQSLMNIIPFAYYNRPYGPTVSRRPVATIGNAVPSPIIQRYGPTNPNSSTALRFAEKTKGA